MIRLLLTLTALTAASPAAAFRAENGQLVEPRGEGAFEVMWSGKSGASNFWCAAGDYARTRLNVPAATEIYRYDAPVRRSGEGILFGFDASRAQPTGLLRLQGGRGLTAAYAQQFCRPPR